MSKLSSVLWVSLPRAINRATSYRDMLVHSDVPYACRKGCVLDVLKCRHLPGRQPLVLHIHGGGFNGWSKDTHGHVAARYARLGCVVFNIDYRLAPEHPYPAAVIDIHDAVRWALDHALEWDADPDQYLITGESAGANLALGVLASMVLPRAETWAQSLFNSIVMPRAMHFGYGLLQVTDMHRLTPAGASPSKVLQGIHRDYIGAGNHCPYADPLPLLERESPTRALPPSLVFWGSKDPIAADSERLVALLRGWNAPVRAHREDGASHGFHLIPGSKSRDCWQAISDHAREHGFGQ